MTRWHVHVVQLRARDIRKGDVVGRDPSRQDGWFRVHEVKLLPDGSVNVLDKGNVRSFIAGPFDLIGLQTPVPLPAEADVTTQRRRNSTDPATPPSPEARPMEGPHVEPSTEAAATTSPTSSNGTGPDALAREAAARTLQAQTDQVRGILPSS